MIELGKYGTDFIVTKSSLDNPMDKNAEDYYNGDIRRLVHDRCTFKGFACWIKHVYDDSVVLQLITNNPSDFIPIVV